MVSIHFARLFAFICFFSIALVTSPVAAQEDRERAKELYNEGAEAYYKQEFPVAIMKFKTGYDLDPDPMFLYNIALAYGRLGNYDEAFEYSERAAKDGLPEDASLKLGARLAAWSTVESSLDVVDDITAPDEGECSSDDDCVDGESCSAENICVAIPEAPPAEGLSGVGWAGVGLTTIGVGLVVGAVILDLGLDDDFEAYDQAVADGDTATANQLKDDIESTQSTGKILLYAGIGSAVVGGGLLVYDLLIDSGSATAVLPVVGRDYAGASLIMRF